MPAGFRGHDEDGSARSPACRGEGGSGRPAFRFDSPAALSDHDLQSFLGGLMVRYFVGLIAIAFISAPVLAQPLADKVPDDAIVYIAWAGTDALADPYKQSR